MHRARSRRPGFASKIAVAVTSDTPGCVTLFAGCSRTVAVLGSEAGLLSENSNA